MIEKLASDKFESAVEKGVSVIDFYAEWCGPCHEMAPVIDALAEENGDLAKFFKVDVDESQELAVRFGIMSIPTLFVLKDGKLSAQFVGITAKAKIEEAIKAAAR